MFKKILISLWIMFIWLCAIPNVNADVSVHLPPSDGSSPDYNEWNHTVVNGNRTYLAVISLVNEYLRFAVWFVCFLFMIINWYKLIISRWDSKQMKSALNSLIWCWVGIAVCLLAYTIVDVAVWLFM